MVIGSVRRRYFASSFGDGLPSTGDGNKVCLLRFGFTALIGIKRVSEVKLKLIFMCCVCSVGFKHVRPIVLVYGAMSKKMALANISAIL